MNQLELLEQALGSAVRYVQNKAKATVLYFDDIPENFITPSIYFQVPRSDSQKVTFTTYKTTLHFVAWFLNVGDWDAEIAAAGVRDCLLLDDCVIDRMNKDGTIAGKGFRVTPPVTTPIDTGIVELSFDILSYFSKEKAPGGVVNKAIFRGLIPPSETYKAWYKATEEQRKDEEVQKECLEKILQNL